MKTKSPLGGNNIEPPAELAARVGAFYSFRAGHKEETPEAGMLAPETSLVTHGVFSFAGAYAQQPSWQGEGQHSDWLK